MSNWISVKDKLPEFNLEENGIKYSRILICTSNKIVQEATYSSAIQGGWLIFGCNGQIPGDPVTHWMPLPEPPETESE